MASKPVPASSALYLGRALLPLRAFLGFTFCFAGLQKLANPRPGGSPWLCGDPAVSGPRRLALPGHGRGHDVHGARFWDGRADG